MNERAPLDPLHLPLKGMGLIEASAGTGKTWTLTALYLRLVLGHGGQPAQLPAHILVVTFTRAATAQLRERIRARLTTAAAAFRGQHETDDYLKNLISEYPSPDARAAAARQLELAAQWMDEAAIYTIHGWSQRMLAQHALEGNEMLEEAADENARLAEIARDYWRCFYAPLNKPEAACVATQWRTPQDLQRVVRPLLRLPVERVRMQGRPLPEMADLSQALRQHQAARRQAEQAARAWWRDNADTIESMLRKAVQAKALKHSIFPPKTLERELPDLREWAHGADIDASTLARYAQAKLDGSARKGCQAPTHKAFQAIQAWLQACEDQAPLKPLLLAHALPWMAARLDHMRARQARPSFDDLLRQLDAALHGPHGQTLAETIASQFPFALIDEFQDTDPLQWRIFERLYADRPKTALLMIGDPKQAIYGFRGADIHTYLAARERALAPTWTLTTNHRATTPLVEAVNRIFQYADQWPNGAFALSRGAQRLTFEPSRAAGAKPRLLHAGAPLPPIHMEVFPGDKPIGVGVYLETAAAHAASHIVDLLQAAQEGRCAFVDAAGTSTALKSRDLAVLVRCKREAACMRAALRQRGVPCVYLSENDSVYATQEASDMLLWLKACALPSCDRTLRAALASATLKRSLEELDRLNHDEQYWEWCGEGFQEFKTIWQRHGVLAMLHRLQHQFGLPARLLAEPGGERVLTHLQHLSELLQHEAANREGEYALIRYLAAQITRAGQGDAQTAEEQVVRLESEADLVKVITIHKAKGLEYPVVILPFLSRCQETSSGSIKPWHDDAGQIWLDLKSDEKAQQHMERERLQEDLRLFYVALTRAEHACWLGVACVADHSQPLLHRSALGYVLAGGQSAIEPATLLSHIQALREGSRDIQVRVAPASPDMRVYHPTRRRSDERPARTYALAPPEPWWIASFSALAKEPAKSMEQSPPATAAHEALVEAVHDSAPWTATTGDEGMHAFPRGAQAGVFLHELLEWSARAGFATVAKDPAMLTQHIERRCQHRGWPTWSVPLSRWLPAWLKTPLKLPDGGTLTLAQVTDRQCYRAELEFEFEAHRLDTLKLDQLLIRHTLGGAPRPLLPPRRIHGMLKGFIDLIVKQQGLYYVIDYKSNWLGDSPAAYTPTAMREAMLRSRYDLQYALYTLALHRLLRARLSGYDYERHVGGALYLYLRGLDSAGHGLHTERLPFALIDAMDRLFAQRAPAHVA